jgi:hypothetical protein
VGPARKEPWRRSQRARSESRLNTPPREFSSAREIVEQVARLPGAIGYVDYRELIALDHRAVRIVRITGDDRSRHPDEAGYPIRHR